MPTHSRSFESFNTRALQQYNCHLFYVFFACHYYNYFVFSPKVWQGELEISKIQPSLRSAYDLFVDLVGKLELSDVADMVSTYEDLNTHFAATVSKITALKKNTKKSTSQAKNKTWELDQEISRVCMIHLLIVMYSF